MGVQVAEKHHAGGSKSLPDIAVLGWDVVEQAARGRDRLACDAEEILEPDRDSGEGWGRFLAARSGAEALVGVGGRRDRVLLIDPHPRVDRRRISVVAVGSVALPDPLEVGRGELRRRHAPVRESRRRTHDPESGQLVHQVRSTSSISSSSFLVVLRFRTVIS